MFSRQVPGVILNQALSNMGINWEEFRMSGSLSSIMDSEF
jgi:hypothetical protein